MLCPRGEIAWTGYYDREGVLKYLTTSKPTREYYYLYKVENGKLEKLGRSKSPIELEERYEVMDACDM